MRLRIGNYEFIHEDDSNPSLIYWSNEIESHTVLLHYLKSINGYEVRFSGNRALGHLGNTVFQNLLVFGQEYLHCHSKLLASLGASDATKSKRED